MSTNAHKPTDAQLEILEIVWAKGKEGATVAEIWEELRAKRDVARTTVLTLVQRLCKKGWLVADARERAHRFRAARPREQARKRMLASIVEGMFGGSPAALVASLLGSTKIRRDEIARLKELLDQRAREVP